MAVIQGGGEYDRCIAFFEKLVADHPRVRRRLAQLRLRLCRQDPGGGLDHPGDPGQQRPDPVLEIDRVASAAGSPSTRAATAICTGPRSSAARRWVSPTSRRRSACATGRDEAKPKKVYARSFVALGDGYWKTDEPEKARAIWQEGLKMFPGEAALQGPPGPGRRRAEQLHQRSARPQQAGRHRSQSAPGG